MHGWDIRSKLEPEAHLSKDCLPVFMDMVPAQLERFILRPGPRLPSPIRYRWELTGTGARNIDAVVEGDRAIIEATGTAKANVTFDCDTETFVLIAFGRLALEAANAAGRLTFEGDNRSASDFQRWFPGM